MAKMAEGAGINMEHSICFFASYFKGETIPYYIKVYLQELKKYFPQLVLLVSNEKLADDELNFLHQHKITVQFEKNEGYDFGMWYKAIQKYDITSYQTVAFINDSSVLFASLDAFVKWAHAQQANLLGMTESHALSHHIQSYFLWCKKPVLETVQNYFRQNGIKEKLDDVIRTYEVGLSTEVLSKGLNIAAFVSNNGYRGEFSPYYYLIDSHLEQKIPLIKKKILFRSYRKDELLTLARMNFNIDTGHYYNAIKNAGGLITDPERLKESQALGLSANDVFMYNLKRLLIKWFRPLYKLVKGR